MRLALTEYSIIQRTTIERYEHAEEGHDEGDLSVVATHAIYKARVEGDEDNLERSRLTIGLDSEKMLHPGKLYHKRLDHRGTHHWRVCGEWKTT